MRGWLFGAFIAAIVAVCTITASYALLNHFYGTQETEMMWKDVAPMAWENAEQFKPMVLTWENAEQVGEVFDVGNIEWFTGARSASWDAVKYSRGTLLTCDNAERVTYITISDWEDAEQSKSPILTISPGNMLVYSYDGGGEDRYFGEGVDGTMALGYAISKSYDISPIPGLASEETLRVGTFIVRETKSISVLPISASIGVATSLMVFAVWIGYKRMWGDAASTLLEQGLHDMTVRDVEIVGQIMDLREFTIPELVRRTRVSKITAWRTVQKLIEQGLVKPTEKTRLAANGLGGRGKPSRIYKYVGARASESSTER